MGCAKSKNLSEEPTAKTQPAQQSSRTANQQGHPSEPATEQRSGSIELPKGKEAEEQDSPRPLPKTPMAPVDESMMMFDQDGHSEIDTLLPGEARAKVSLMWQGSCFGSGEVSASSSKRGVAFHVEPSFVAVGLKAAPGKPNDSYGALDYAFYCMEHGRVQIYERGELKHTIKDKYSEDSTLEIHLRAHPHAVEYMIDEQMVYMSQTEPPKNLHFQICFGDHPAAVTDICYVMTSA